MIDLDYGYNSLAHMANVIAAEERHNAACAAEALRRMGKRQENPISFGTEEARLLRSRQRGQAGARAARLHKAGSA